MNQCSFIHMWLAGRSLPTPELAYAHSYSQVLCPKCQLHELGIYPYQTILAQ